MLNGYEIVLIFALALLLFGAKKLPELARGLGQGIREFKKASREVTDQIESAMHAEPVPQRQIPPTVPAEEPAHPAHPAQPAQPQS